MFWPLLGAARSGDDEQRLAERDQLGELGLGARLRSRPIRVAPVKLGPAGDGQIGHALDLGQRELFPGGQPMGRGGSLTLQTGPILTAYASSKSVLNSIATQYARRFAETHIIVNAICRGYVATDFTGFASSRTPEQGAAVAIRLATVPDGGPRGGFFDEAGVIP